MSVIPRVYAVSLSNGVHNIPKDPSAQSTDCPRNSYYPKSTILRRMVPTDKDTKRSMDLESSRKCHIPKEHAFVMLEIDHGCAFCK
jgi:hypothetical protein